MNYEYKEYPGVTHGPIMAASMPDIYAFFAKHSKPASRWTISSAVIIFSVRRPRQRIRTNSQWRAHERIGAPDRRPLGRS